MIRTATRWGTGAKLLAILLWAVAGNLTAQERMLRLPPVKSRESRPAPSVDSAPQPAPLRVAQNSPHISTPEPLPPVQTKVWQETEDLPAQAGWWEPRVQAQQIPQSLPNAVQPDELILRALMYSEDVLAVSLGPSIRAEGILKAATEFDPATFFESRWDDLSQPVGNTLTTGGPTRFNDHHLQGKAGLRQKTALGGNLEFAQELGLQDTNSLFFNPKQQAASRMTLSFTQPLLKHGGYEYNQSMILLAEIDTTRAYHQLAGELQDHAFEVIRAYWDLYLQRALYLQRQRAHEQAEQILNELKGREQIDSLRSQIARARAAVAVRRAAWQRAELGTRNAQSRIVTLTNDPEWRGNQALELTPAEAPISAAASPELQSAFQTALMFRPELAATTERVREAQVRLGISKNELLPTLNLVVESYVAGLDGNYDVPESFGNQFNDGAPSYGAGLIFQVPWGNRQAKADYRRRDFELAQIVHSLKAVLSRVALDVEIAVNDVEATYREMLGRYEALVATDEEVKYLQDRWRLLPGEDRAVSFVLEELLDAQDRQMEAEAAFVRAQIEYTVSQYALQKATGTLLHMGRSGAGTLTPEQVESPPGEPTQSLPPPTAHAPPPVRQATAKSRSYPSQELNHWRQ